MARSIRSQLEATQIAIGKVQSGRQAGSDFIRTSLPLIRVRRGDVGSHHSCSRQVLETGLFLSTKSRRPAMRRPQNQRRCLRDIVGHVAIDHQAPALLAQHRNNRRKRRTGRMRQTQPDALRRNSSSMRECWQDCPLCPTTARSVGAAIDT